MKKCSHPRLKSFTFSSGEVMSLCLDCSFGLGHEESNLYTRRRGATAVEPELEPELEPESSPESSELTELTETGLPTFSDLDDENESPTIASLDDADEGAEMLEEEVEEEV